MKPVDESSIPKTNVLITPIDIILAMPKHFTVELKEEYKKALDDKMKKILAQLDKEG